MHNLLQLLSPEKRKWPEHLPELMCTYSAVSYALTTYSPCYLMFLRDTRSPAHLLLETEDANQPEIEWLAAHKECLRDTYLKAGEQLRHQADARKAANDKKSYDPPVERGQFVYLRSHPKGRNNIQDAWDPTLYRVENAPGPDSSLHSYTGPWQQRTSKESTPSPDENLRKDSTAMSSHKSYQSFQLNVVT